MLADGCALTPRPTGSRVAPGTGVAYGDPPGHHFGYPSLVHLGHPELPSVDGEHLAFGRDMPESVEEEYPQRHVLPLGEIDPQAVVDIVDAHPPVHQPPT